MKRTLFIFSMIFAVVFNATAQEADDETLSSRELRTIETELVTLFTQVNAAETNQEKFVIADSIQAKMVDLVYYAFGAEYSFNRIKRVADRKQSQKEEQSIPFGMIQSNDEAVTVFYWSILLTDGSSQYYNIFQHKDGNTYILAQGIPFQPKTTGTVSEKDWYGAVYYELLHMKDSRGKDAYLALGYACDAERQYKYIDVLTFSGKTVKLGAAAFTGLENRRQMRAVFEYPVGMVMSLKSEGKKKIIFNHLSDSGREYDDGTPMLGPDMSFDSLILKKDKWVLKEDIKVKSKKKKRRR